MNLIGRNLQQGLTVDDLRLLRTELTLLNLSRRRAYGRALRLATRAWSCNSEAKHASDQLRRPSRYSGRHQHYRHRTVPTIPTGVRRRRLADGYR